MLIRKEPRRSRLSVAVPALLSLLLAASAARADQDPGVEHIERTHTALSRSFSDVASGLEVSLKKDDVGTAETLYGMERSAIDLLQMTADAKFPTAATRLNAQAGIRSLLQRILNL